MSRRCPICRSGCTETKAPADGRPMWVCSRCNYRWTEGRAK